MRKHLLALNAITALMAGTYGAGTHAAGFQLLEQNASGLGNAYAGSAANPENASTIYFNPAGMTYLPGGNVSAGANAIWPSFKFRDNGNSRNPTVLGGTAPTGGNSGDAGHLGIVPNAYLSYQVAPKWWLGIGMGAPFGLMTEYDSGWAGQYHSNKFEITTININPSIAYKVSDQLSFGIGANWQRIDAEYQKKTVVPLVPAAGIFTNGDARLKMHGDAWGWNAGIMFQPVESTRIGVSYRSTMKQDARGNTDVNDIALPGGATTTASYAASTTVKLPDQLILSASHQLTPRWQLLGDISWTGWSSLQSLDISNRNGPSDSLPLNFRDTWRIALGANYQINEQWKWKVGVAFDQSPVHKAEDRLASLPDTDRWWFSTGVQYQATKNIAIDVGYTYLYLRDSDIDTTSGNQLSKGRLAGSYDSKGNIVGVQVSARF
ncbi:outer membrane protein transport protein [Bordetella genomosp. 13]|uniref:OmpP1/FadL family transporter n=1 Tax=Bordetella genomosp. 13 TaxID=463040 RepID=UPI0011A1B5D9